MRDDVLIVLLALLGFAVIFGGPHILNF